jgi:hypothetical protein
MPLYGYVIRRRVSYCSVVQFESFVLACACKGPIHPEGP